MIYDFDTPMNRRNNGSMKWEDAYILKRFELTNTTPLFPLFIADMDFKMAPELKEKVMELLETPDFGYFHVQDGFYQSIVDWYSDIHDISIDRTWITPSIGTITTLNLLCDLFGRDQDIVIMPPVYGPFKTCSQVGHTREVPLKNTHGRYRIDYSLLEQTFKKYPVKILMLCHPHNPGGIAFSKEELIQLVDLCKAYGVLMLVDEIHGDLNLTSKHFTSMIELSDRYEKIIVSTSANKSFNIPGLTTSYTLCRSEALRQQYIDYLNHLHLGYNRMGIQMTEIAYTCGKSWFQALRRYIQDNVEFTLDALNKAGIQAMTPDSGYLIWMKLDGVEDIRQFVLELAKKTHVLIEDGSRFVSCYEGYVRINVATSRSLLQEALKLFIHFYEGYIHP